MRVLVTGCAGFIGSTVSARLLDMGCDVVGVDVFTDYYDRRLKEANLSAVRGRPRMSFVEADINDIRPADYLGAGDAVVHEAAQAGVRKSWGADFNVYVHNNVLGTQRLLEGCKDLGLSRFVYAGSSSAYGDALRYPTLETDVPRPLSPYGVTKLAGEHLCGLYRVNHGIPTTVLRYFTVFGPRQRPDMAFHRWCKAALLGEPLPLFDDGEQTRDFTFINDAVAATVAAIDAPRAVGEVINVGGGNRVSVNEVLAILSEIAKRPLDIRREEKQRGDVRHTGADVAKAREILGWSAGTGLRDGLAAEYEFIRALYGGASGPA